MSDNKSILEEIVGFVENQIKDLDKIIGSAIIENNKELELIRRSKKVALEDHLHILKTFYLIKEKYQLSNQEQREKELFVIQHRKTLIIHGAFYSYESAHRYINGASEYVIRELEIH